MANATNIAGNWNEFWKTEPFWRSELMQGESMMLVQDTEGEAAWSSFLFPLGQLQQVRMANRSMVFEEGRDYIIDREQNRLVVAQGSRMPWKKLEDFFPIEGEQRSKIQINGQDRAIWWVEGHVLHDLHVEVTYTHSKDDWKGPKPGFAGELLPATMKRLNAGETFRATLFGDSISVGGNASGKVDAPPHMPQYGKLAIDCLENRYGTKIEFANCSEGGMGSEWGVENIDRVLPTKPNLAIIAWGMNDASAKISGDVFSGFIQAQMKAIREVQPDVEFVLVASATANPAWTHYGEGCYNEHLAALRKLQGPGVAVADVNSMWTEVLKHKRFQDIIANGVNHPNDFGHRLYTQVLLSLFIEDYE